MYKRIIFPVFSDVKMREILFKYLTKWDFFDIIAMLL